MVHCWCLLSLFCCRCFALWALCVPKNQWVCLLICWIVANGAGGSIGNSLNLYIELGLALLDKLHGISSFLPSLKSRESGHMTRPGIFRAPKCLKYTEIVQVVSQTVGWDVLKLLNICYKTNRNLLSQPLNRDHATAVVKPCKALLRGGRHIFASFHSSYASFLGVLLHPGDFLNSILPFKGVNFHTSSLACLSVQLLAGIEQLGAGWFILSSTPVNSFKLFWINSIPTLFALCYRFSCLVDQLCCLFLGEEKLLSDKKYKALVLLTLEFWVFNCFFAHESFEV